MAKKTPRKKPTKEKFPAKFPLALTRKTMRDVRRLAKIGGLTVTQWLRNAVIHFIHECPASNEQLDGPKCGVCGCRPCRCMFVVERRINGVVVSENDLGTWGPTVAGEDGKP